MITQERLKSVLHYDPVDGVFIWRVSAGSVCSGSPAGCLDDSGYVRIKIDRKKYKAHRLAFLYMTGEVPPQVDHADMDKSNNSWNNLRAADNTLNNANRNKQSNNTSGYRGVSWFKPRNKWRALIKVRGKHKYLGLFSDPEKAYEAYKKAAVKEFGEFSRLA